MKKPRRLRSRSEPAARKPPTKMWVRTADGQVVWVEGPADQLPAPDAVRETRRREQQDAERQRAHAQKAHEPLRFRCPNCRHALEAPRAQAGEPLRCPGCQLKMLVPAPDDLPSKPVAVECLRCGTPNHPAIGTCARCSEPLPVARGCASCGTMWLRPTIEFCPRCGLELEHP